MAASAGNATVRPMKEEDDLVRVALPPRWLEWAVEIQFLAQAGITYTKDSYDLERFERLRDIAAEIMSARSGLDMDTVRGLFCNETGFQTPKMDTRAAISGTATFFWSGKRSPACGPCRAAGWM